MKPLDPRVLPHLAVARGPLAVVLVGNVVAGLLIVGQAFALAALVAGLLTDPAGTGWHTAAVWLAVVTVLRAVTARVVDVAASRAAGRVGVRLRRLVLRSVLDHEATALRRRRTGELATLATRGVAAVEPYLTRYLPALVLAAVLPLVAVVAIITQDWLSALIVVATLPLVPVFAILIGLTTQEKADRQWRALGTLAGHFLDVVRGLPTLVAHRRAEAQVSTIAKVTDTYRKRTNETLKVAFASSAALELIATISVALVAVVVGLRLAGGNLELQVALTVLLLAPEAYWPLRRVGAEYHSAAEGTATFEAIHQLTNAQSLCRERSIVDARKLNRCAPAPLRLIDVALAWPDREPIIAGVDATIPAHGITAIVGPSGCGKSTLLQVLLGELPLAGGVIAVGDEDHADLERTTWRSQVAHLAQRPWLVAGTIAENLRIARPDASDADVWAALATVDLASHVASLPGGIDTDLGEEGLGLSAGQRARLGLARVVLAERPYVFLDEPSAHLDADSERIIIEVIRYLAETSTVVVVAHRDAVVAAADTVIDLGTASRHELTDSVAESARIDGPVRQHVPTRRLTASTRADSAPDGSAHTGGLWALTVLLATLAAASGVALTATAGWLIARAAEQPPVLMLTVAIVGVRTFGLARPALHYVERLLGHDVALRHLSARRAGVFARLIPLAPARLGRQGDLLTGIVEDVDAELDDRLRVQLPIATWLGVAVLATLTAYVVLPASALPVLVVSLGGGLAALLAGWTGARRHEERFIQARADVGRRTTDLVNSARPLVLWQADDRALEGVDHAGDELAAAATHSNAATATGRALATLLAGLGVVWVAWLGAPALAAGDVSGPMLALLLLLPLALAESTAALAEAGALRVRTRAAATRVDALLDTLPAVTEPARAAALPAGPTRIHLHQAAASWAPGAPAFTGVDLDLTPGRHIGVTGPSGSGKSSLAMVLARFLDTNSGDHEVNGQPVATSAADDVRRRVGLLGDDPYLFGSTLVENVRLAAPEADDLAVELALRQAHLGPWLEALPEGLHTRIGDGGRAVSGGERARIGLARALLAGRDVLVLDEPTAHLDGATARAVAADLLAANQGRSLVWITHDRIGLDAMDEVLDLVDQPQAQELSGFR
ncbi:thiol reductant ABC exporter subunit CydD [Nocardioides sp. AE5]|uniref:thiol reductant ABC exporter subunit CydD n=1 Tax=Nocardioides sp. AE5 TaxID=2962573 RepID=UPI002881A471|nr:thiol reductant ABC exporter subunit CydD [Nocardioides sp. AE5]MDT0201772.1 thiol reductant ABC exporter subunit CydD [Nocardioides sp. AE5]